MATQTVTRATGIAILSYAFPACSIFLGFLSLAFPFVFGQYVPGLILACGAMLASIAGLVMLVLKKWNGLPTHLAGLAICVAAIFVAINALLLRASIETNSNLLAQNEKAASQAKTDREDAKRKLADAEEAFRKADEAPKKAEAFYKSAKDAQDKADAAEKRTEDLLAKAEELERKNDQDRKRIAEDRGKLEVSEKAIKALQKTVNQTQKDIEDKRQELVTLKKEIESDRKTAADELAVLKKEIDADRKKAEEKEKDAKAIMKKIEEILKGASLKLQDKNPQVRYKTAKQFAKLPVFPESKEILGEAVCQAILDPSPDVKTAALEALEKIDPTVHPHMVTLMIGQNKALAIHELGTLGKKAKSALPVLIYYHQTGKGKEFSTVLGHLLFLDPLTKIAPSDKRISQLVLNEVAKKTSSYTRSYALTFLDKIDVDTTVKLDVLLIALNDGDSAVEVIAAIAKIGPDAAKAVPALNKLKFSPDDVVRQAAIKALSKIEKAK